MKIKKGDSVVVLTGKDKGKSGTVVRAFPKKAQVLVEGMNLVTKHEKSRQRGQQGQRITRPMPMDVSNVALRGKQDKPVRVGYTVEKQENGKVKKFRVSRPSGEKI